MTTKMNRIKDQGDDRKYFFIVQHYVHDRCEDVYQFSLWCTIKMIAGEEGECFLGTPELAALAMMSTGKASEARRRLIDLGLLKGEIVRDRGYSQAVWHIRVPDLWATNVKWREANHSLLDRVERKANRHREPSPGESKPSPGESKPSPGETKKNHVKKNHKEDAPLPPATFLPGTKFNDHGAPIVEMDSGDLTYECPYPTCGKNPAVPGRGLKGGYVTPCCEQPAELRMDGQLYRTAKKPSKPKEELKTLGNLFSGAEVIRREHRDIPYFHETGKEIEAWFRKGELAVIAFNDTLTYLMGQGVPRHLLAQNALTGARKMFEVEMADEGEADEPTEERGDGAEDVYHEGGVLTLQGVGLDIFD